MDIAFSYNLFFLALLAVFFVIFPMFLHTPSNKSLFIISQKAIFDNDNHYQIWFLLNMQYLVAILFGYFQPK